MTTSAPKQTVTLEHLEAEVAGIEWWHQIDLGHGIVTPGRDQSAAKLERLRLPDDLSGRSVLDVGAWDGFFSFEAERRGARRVVAVDALSWSGSGWGTKAGFELARRVLHSRVEDQEVDLFELSPQIHGTFDVVLFLGVLYHLRHPLLALERLSSVTGELLILETHVDMLWARRPCIAFYPGAELQNDATNWVGPNPKAVEAMLRTVGFQRIEIVWKDSTLRRLGRMLRRTTSRSREALLPLLQQARIVVHAWK